jgi:hypothetical protein
MIKLVAAYHPIFSTGLGPKVSKVPRVSVGSKLFCTAPLQLLSSSGQIATVMAHWTVKVPCKNIKAVTLGGYICTIFGSSTGVPPKVAYCGNT